MGKGTYTTDMHGTMNKNGNVTAFIGSGSPKAFEKRIEKEKRRNKN